ncbi:hypothetical protein PVL29_009259 [Vitis rotundifolia]|uniref:Uncharacterized protein n=1 Tax=Vitis rotundifolia TaxID=103349 RepID=A0AA38ZZU8_VITRO|nr:hypothetical protein PVL29_009259 [Vitis rotundifolia]
MFEKDSASFLDYKEKKKKIKLDRSSSDRSTFDVKQEKDGSKEEVKDSSANAIAVNEGSLNKPRSLQETEIRIFFHEYFSASSQ